MFQVSPATILRSLVLVLLALPGLSTAMSQTSESQILEELINKLPGPWPATARKPEHAVQILYVSVNQSDEGPQFTEHRWQLDPECYFYPASTVKLPVALFALEKLASLKEQGISRRTTMLTEAARPWQTTRDEDPSSPSGKPCIENDVRHLFVVSDNDAYNRLYEFVGLEQIQRRLEELGCEGTRIQHRLAVKRAIDHGRITNPIRFLDDQNTPLWRQGEAVAPETLITRHTTPALLGKGVFQAGEVLPGPKDFSRHNAFPLADQYRCLRAIFFPESTPSPLQWLPQDRAFAIKMMGLYPEECEGTADSKIRGLPKTYVKSFLDWPESPVPSTLRCYNKLGEAYGFLIDSAYIVDEAHDVSFFLSAVIQVNANQIINDDRYEYEKIGRPFLGALGEALYRHERAPH